MNEKLNKTPWIITALLAIGVAVLLWERKDGSNVRKNLTLDFPPGFDRVVDQTAFQAALDNYSLPYPNTGNAKRTHVVYYCGKRAERGGPPAPDIKTGSHVSQYVSFADMQNLENFVKTAFSPTAAPPCPKE